MVVSIMQSAKFFADRNNKIVLGATAMYTERAKCKKCMGLASFFGHDRILVVLAQTQIHYNFHTYTSISGKIYLALGQAPHQEVSWA